MVSMGEVSRRGFLRSAIGLFGAAMLGKTAFGCQRNAATEPIRLSLKGNRDLEFTANDYGFRFVDVTLHRDGRAELTIEKLPNADEIALHDFKSGMDVLPGEDGNILKFIVEGDQRAIHFAEESDGHKRIYALRVNMLIKLNGEEQMRGPQINVYHFDALPPVNLPLTRLSY